MPSLWSQAGQHGSWELSLLVGASASWDTSSSFITVFLFQREKGPQEEP